MSRKYSPEKQQELMEKSLRNVRGLVEKIEAEEAARKRAQKIVIAAIVGVTLLLVGMITLMLMKPSGGRPVLVSPDRPAGTVPAK